MCPLPLLAPAAACCQRIDEFSHFVFSPGKTLSFMFLIRKKESSYELNIQVRYESIPYRINVPPRRWFPTMLSEVCIFMDFVCFSGCVSCCLNNLQVNKHKIWLNEYEGFVSWNERSQTQLWICISKTLLQLINDRFVVLSTLFFQIYSMFVASTL